MLKTKNENSRKPCGCTHKVFYKREEVCLLFKLISSYKPSEKGGRYV